MYSILLNMPWRQTFINTSSTIGSRNLVLFQKCFTYASANVNLAFVQKEFSTSKENGCSQLWIDPDLRFTYHIYARAIRYLKIHSQIMIIKIGSHGISEVYDMLACTSSSTIKFLKLRSYIFKLLRFNHSSVWYDVLKSKRIKDAEALSFFFQHRLDL